MNNFGVIEISSARTTNAPGWAYVPDTSVAAPQQQQPKNRKRARAGGPAVSQSDLSARQDAKRRKDLLLLDRDGGAGHKEAQQQVPVPAKGRAAATKFTPAVRKILMSQKTFANHLDDFEAAIAQEAGGGSNSFAPTSIAAAAAGSSSRSFRRESKAPSPPARRPQDVDMPDADAENKQEGSAHDPNTGPAHVDPLLASRVPPAPTQAEIAALLSAPPLSYTEARGGWSQRYPVRVFCTVCGYWGRVKCIKCGTRVCALDCLELHREECITRYGL